MNRAWQYSLICTVSILILVPGTGCRSWADEPNDYCLGCHGNQGLRSPKGKSRYIDPHRFAESAHGDQGVRCTACHKGITPVSKGARIPHRMGTIVKCSECHAKVSRQYSRSRHARVSKKICYSCHNPHYWVPFEQLSGRERRAICLKCHDAYSSHRWLPQRLLHFKYLECTSCHALNAEIGLIFSIVDNVDSSHQNVLDYQQIQRAVATAKTGIGKILAKERSNEISGADLTYLVDTLRQKGYPHAGLKARILVINPTHNFTDRAEHTRDCTLCHSKDARFYSEILLSIPETGGGIRTFRMGKGILARLSQQPYMRNIYLLGGPKITRADLNKVLAILEQIGFKWIDIIGIAMVGFSLLIISFHATVMFFTRRYRRGPRHSEIVGPASVTLRVWHWIHGLNVLLLLFTGIQLRLPDTFPLFATFLNAVDLHNLCGTLVAADYVFWLSYNLWKRQLASRFFVSPGVLFRDMLEVVHYYGYLIFTGGSYPKTYGDYRSFDPAERVFFVLLMLCVVPVQIFTGALLYDVQTNQPLITALGGLRLVDGVHILTAYMLISSMVFHLYFHTLKKYRRVTFSTGQEKAAPSKSASGHD